MKLWSPLTIALAAGGAGVLISAGTVIYLKLRRKKDPAELERLRRISVSRTGRIISGEIVGLLEPDSNGGAPLSLVYRYDVAGVTYEVAQDVSLMPPVATAAAHLVGRAISVKYETKHPSNSIIVCEEWSGIRGINFHEPEGAGGLPISAEAAGKS